MAPAILTVARGEGQAAGVRYNTGIQEGIPPLQYVEPATERSRDIPRLEPGIRCIIAFKLFLGILYLFVGMGAFGVLSLLVHQNLDVLADRVVAIFKVDPDNDILNTLLDKIAGITPQTLGLVGGGTFLYGALELTEAVGLLLRKRWAEWLVVVATSIFIPVEIREIVHGILHPTTHTSTWFKIGVFVINVAIVVYLIWSKGLLRQSNAGDAAA
ncbi:MAG: DUF2127 domain-containing protein [Cyanobacteria bacterium REEB65]|nr:DUF2127 domain-containing protein [Cyanobacteria bacterium REEB65]